MKKLISCEFNIDTACVELKYSDGSMISINCTAVEDEVANSRFQRSELDWLIYNDPLSYAELILNGDPRRIPANRNGDSAVRFRLISKAARGTSMRCCFWRLFYILSIKANTTACCSSLNLDHRSRSSFVNQSEKPVNLLLRIAEKA